MELKLDDEVLFIKKYRELVQAGEIHVIDKVIKTHDEVSGIYIKLDTTYIYLDNKRFKEHCVVINSVSKDLEEIEDKIMDATIDKIIKAQDNYLKTKIPFCQSIKSEGITKESIKKPEKYDYINPSHYLLAGRETFDMMVDIWGKDLVIAHCEMNAFKYRMRVGKKPNQPVEQDLKKAEWYENKAKSLRNG